MNLLYLSYCPPQPTWGGAMAFYRHFFERSEFDVLVATTAKDSLPYSPVKFSAPAWWERLNRTRLHPWTYSAQLLYGHYFLPYSVWSAAAKFRPDAVFTIAGSWDWTTLAAQRIARKLDIPLIASFNDWWDYGWGPHVALPNPAAIENRFRNFYRESDLALCTCEGMREELGDHPNAHVLYPTGAAMPDEVPAKPAGLPFTVFFGGNLGDWYGPMIERLINASRQSAPNIRFRIFGSNPAWSEDFLLAATNEGTYGGPVSFEELRFQATKADLLILPMGFGEACAQVERTSFKTKFLDYLTFSRPVVAWGPEYCSAVRTAREFDSAECVTTPNPVDCASILVRLSQTPERLANLRHNARKMYEDRFNPDRIHVGLVQAIRNTIGGKCR